MSSEQCLDSEKKIITKRQKKMVRFDMIPYVFEFAKIQTGWDEKKCGGKFSLRYEEYAKYLELFDSLEESKQMELVDRVRSKGKKNM